MVNIAREEGLSIDTNAAEILVEQVSIHTNMSSVLSVYNLFE
jgi:hypothetical protein